MGKELFFLPEVSQIATLTLHFETVREVLNNFPVPIFYGEPGTGKTTALRCVMAALGALGALDHIYSKVTSASIRVTLSQSSVSVGIDDPSSKKDAEGKLPMACKSPFQLTIHHMHMYVEWNCNTYCAPCIYTCNYTCIHVLYAYTVACMHGKTNQFINFICMPFCIFYNKLIYTGVPLGVFSFHLRNCL